ncbi:cell wall metabolism sensor histidine kinase WalK, partial [Patescibacteria group bacterium]|nr:cell wall metabolism sensor histidine kinase WalK [Patescibacteria group bacterium]MBU1421258.1 cell wall metabolism sensor histidine kinase WalK [Patescibacteria group bacterium]
EGTGLGLYVARKMVEAHNGKIWAESKGENRGSQFYFQLPVG